MLSTKAATEARITNTGILGVSFVGLTFIFVLSSIGTGADLQNRALNTVVFLTSLVAAVCFVRILMMLRNNRALPQKHIELLVATTAVQMLMCLVYLVIVIVI